MNKDKALSRVDEEIRNCHNGDFSSGAACTIIDEVYDAFESQTCDNCRHYRLPGGDPKVRVCIEIDDHYTQHYCGYFMPPEDFGCNKFSEKQHE